MIPGLEASDQKSFHGFTTYGWMIKKAISCTVHCVENTANHKKGVGQCTVLTVLQNLTRCFQKHYKRRSVNFWLKTSFLLMKRPVRILFWGKPCRGSQYYTMGKWWLVLHKYLLYFYLILTVGGLSLMFSTVTSTIVESV